MNLESMQRSSETIHVSAPGSLIRQPQTIPQRNPRVQESKNPFAIQELLGLSESSRTNGAVSAVTSSFYGHNGPSQFNASDHHQMMASRMHFLQNFNAHAAAAAAAFLPHNMAANGSHLGLHPQASGK
jgi:hypothetical protein